MAMNGFPEQDRSGRSFDGSIHDVATICVLAGKILLQSGAETYRVEDTMNRLARGFHVEDAQSFVTPTGIIFSIESTDITKLVRINNRSINLRKVTEVNRLSRAVANGHVMPTAALSRLRAIDGGTVCYRSWLQILAAAASSSCFLIMFLGRWQDAFPAFIAGGAGQAAVMYFHRLTRIKFFSECLASVLVGTIAVYSVRLGVGTELDKIIIGAVMPLVPGVPVTNAVRDIMAGDLMSGLAKTAEAGLTAFAIGTGIAMAIVFY